MRFNPSRRSLITGGAAVAAFASLPAQATKHLHGASAGGASSAFVFSQVNKASNILVSGDGLTASFNGATTDNVWGTVYCTVGFTTGKRVIEFTINSLSNNARVGITTGDGAITAALGDDGHAVGFDAGGSVIAPSISFDDIAGAFFAAGNTVMIADDATNGFTYAQSSAQASWIGRQSVTDDPNTGTGGLDEANSFFSAHATRYFGVSLKNIGDSITINTTIGGTIPTGYSA